MKRLVLIVVCIYICLSVFADSYYDYIDAARKGDARAQTNLGVCYENGKGIAQDYYQAAYWYKRSAKQGDALAQYNLGLCYYYGHGVTQDYNQAVYWYKKSAEQGEKAAQNGLGVCYYNGHGVTRDYNQAMYWYRKSAEQGERTGQYNLGMCYYYGRGVTQDYNQAVYWYRKSAEQGEKVAQCKLGKCYYNGEGVTQDYNQAIYWFEKSVNQGYNIAYNGLAYCYAAQNDFTKAHYTLDKLINMEPTEAKWYDSKGELYVIQNDYVKAMEMWNKVVSIDSGYSRKHSNLYIALFERETIDFVIPKDKNTSADYFAIIIANENYKREGNVPFASNDGNIFYKYCTQTLGIPEKHIMFVKDASLNEMKYNFNWLKQVAEAYDGEAKVIVYYSGHGIPDEANKNAYLLPSDGYGSDVTTGYKVSDLYIMLGSLPIKYAVVFLDACFSGSKKNGQMMTSAKGVAIKTKNDTPCGNVVVMTASQGDETAYANNDAQHGMFTYYLLKKLQESKGNVSLEELSSYIISNVKKTSIIENGKSQTPCVLASPNVANEWQAWKLK